MGQGGYEEHMAPGGQSVLCFLIPSVNYSYFMYRLRFCINKRQVTHGSLAVFVSVGQGGTRSTWLLEVSRCFISLFPQSLTAILCIDYDSTSTGGQQSTFPLWILNW